MFNKYVKNVPNYYVSHNWKKTLRNREIAKNNYRLSGDIKKANAFVKLVQNCSVKRNTVYHTFFETVIYSNDTNSVPLLPVFTFNFVFSNSILEFNLI